MTRASRDWSNVAFGFIRMREKIYYGRQSRLVNHMGLGIEGEIYALER